MSKDNINTYLQKNWDCCEKTPPKSRQPHQIHVEHDTRDGTKGVLQELESPMVLLSSSSAPKFLKISKH